MGENMKKILTIIISLVWILIIFATATGQETTADSLNIEITTEENSISVIETYSIDAGSSETLSFWIQESPTDLSILIDGSNIEYYTTLPIGDNRYFCNISHLNVTTDSSIQVSYYLDLDTTEFEKTMQYNTTSISIKFDGKEIYAGANLKSESFLSVPLQKPTQSPSETIESIPVWVYVIIVVLLILLLVSFMARSRKTKTTKTKETIGGSEELLSTKKALLMEVLKDIEKKHRAKQISDNTYHKLKDKYKQEAVEAMRQLENMKSKGR
jgi:hypothetical protein